MAGLRFRIHPLFLVFGIVYLILGELLIFLIYTFTAILHELGHLMQAERLGYTVNKLTLMPYGAVLDGSLSGLKLKDEAAFALAGPMLNLFTAVLFTAVWWIAPETYAFTDTIVTANLTIGLVNLIPAYPLDGGRIVFSALGLKWGERVAKNILKIMGLIFFLCLFGLFILSAFKKINFSLLFFSIFILIGLFEKPRQSAYIRIFNFSKKRLERGVRIKTYAVASTATLKKIIRLIDADCFVKLTVLDCEGRVLANFSHKQLISILQKGSIYDSIGKFITAN